MIQCSILILVLQIILILSFELTIAEFIADTFSMFCLIFKFLINVSSKYVGFCNSVLAATFRSQAQRKDIWYESKLENPSPIFHKNKTNKGMPEPLLPTDESTSSSPTKAKSFSDSQLETFNYQHGVFILHLLATLMFVPSLVAWLQVRFSLCLLSAYTPLLSLSTNCYMSNIICNPIHKSMGNANDRSNQLEYEGC